MRASKYVVILLTVTLAGIAAAEKSQQVPSAQTGQQAASGGQPRTDAEAVNLGGQKSELARKAHVLELDLAGVDARRKALQEQITALRGDSGKGAADSGQLNIVDCHSETACGCIRKIIGDLPCYGCDVIIEYNSC